MRTDREGCEEEPVTLWRALVVEHQAHFPYMPLNGYASLVRFPLSFMHLCGLLLSVHSARWPRPFVITLKIIAYVLLEHELRRKM